MSDETKPKTVVCPNCGKPLKQYPCGYGNPNDLGCCPERKDDFPPMKHDNCRCQLTVIDKQEEQLKRLKNCKWTGL